MDLNLIVLCGRLAVEGELRTFDSGTRLIRYLVTTRVDYPRSRVDVVPVTLWDPPQELVDEPGEKGSDLGVRIGATPLLGESGWATKPNRSRR